MSSYFDDLERRVREVSDLRDEILLKAVQQIEAPIIRTVSLVTGDREFPNDLREKIQQLIAAWRVEHPEGSSWLLTTKSSMLITQLHRAFHEVAERRIVTRFGLLNDDPLDILKRRDAHDEEAFQ